MSLKPYSEYKDSGVEWLGEIPTAWSVSPLWYLFKRSKRLGTGYEELLSVYRDYGVIPKSSRDDNFNKASDDLSKYQIVGVGDLVINKMKAWQGSVAVSEYDGIVSPAYFVFRALITTDLRFMHYLMRSIPYFQHYASISSGVRPNQWDLDPDLHRLMPVLVPPLSEQTNIATYLDRETAEIDAFIADQEELIDLLTERRTATITRAVTKGLDPNVPMNDSEVEWFGLLPSNWEFVPIKRNISYLTSGSRDWASFYADQGVPFIRIGNLTRGHLNLDMQDTQYVSIPEKTEGQRSRLRKDDVLFSITAYLGSVAVVDDENAGSYISQHVAMVRPLPDKLNSRFLGYCVLSDWGQRQLSEQAYGGTKIQISLGDIKNFKCTIPPRREQDAIVTYLDIETAEFDAAIADAREAIALSKERRAAVISAAVTGKIDVRGLIDPGTIGVEGASVGAA
ncbi:restriction endonuclease subunit S [Glutamicibacter arilaitensis]|uniref:restriction endonuclease subunit S n=1 Tax=Glutamicibacter arilaitensis TaxID=256701 RepID=UPI003F8DC6D0